MTGVEANQAKPDEVTPLLSRQGQGSWTNDAKKPAKKPSPWYIISPIFGLTLCFGGLYAPMMQFYTVVFCNRYYQTQSGEIEDIPYENCTIPEVQSIVSEAQAIIMFLISTTTLFVASYYGALSDRKGRKVVLKIAGLGNIIMTASYIITFKYQKIVGISLLFIAPVIRALLAGDTVVFATVQSYISDCTTSTERTVFFGRMVSALYLGAAMGPTLASLIIKQTGTIMSVFYIVLGINVLFELYVLFVLPESHDFEQFKQPDEQKSFLQSINVFSALHILTRTSSKHANRYALFIIAAITFIFTIVALPPSLLYAMLKFNWTAYEGGIFISLSCFSKLIILALLLPLLSKIFHKDRASAKNIKQDNQDSSETSTSQVIEEQSDDDIRHSLLFDTWMIRTGLVAEVGCFVLFGLVTTSKGFTLTAMLQSFAALALPSLRSIITNLVPANEIGELMGAVVILESCGMMLSQLTINTIYSASVGTMPQLIFFVCAAIAFIACVLSFFVKPRINKAQNVQA